MPRKTIEIEAEEGVSLPAWFQHELRQAVRELGNQVAVQNKARITFTIENQTGAELDFELVRDDKRKEFTVGDQDTHSFDTFERQEWRLVIR